MSFEFLDDSVTSDVTFRVRAPDLAGLFRDAARATASVMVPDLDSIRSERQITVTLHHSEPDLLLARFLEELIFYKDAEGLILVPAMLRVDLTGGEIQVEATLTGETLDPERHERGSDVKAVTMHGLVARPSDHGWEAEVTLDV